MSFTSFLSDRGSPAPQGPAPSSTSFLQTAQFSQPSASPSSPQSSSSSEPTAESLFSSPKFDPASLHPLAGLGNDQQLDYLLLEDDKTNMEGGSLMGNKSYLDDMQTGAGTAYVTGTYALSGW
jgi:import inner membrane translocase subunit TIM23